MTQDDRESQLKAEMRLAFTRAAVIFPKAVNRDPITMAVYNIFSDVFYTLKRELRWPIGLEMEPFDPRFIETISSLVDQTVSDLVCKGVVGPVLSQAGPDQAKKIAPFIAGLPYPEAKMLYQLVKDRDPKASRQRGTMLRNRRNLLANQLTVEAFKAAREYFTSEASSA